MGWYIHEPAGGLLDLSIGNFGGRWLKDMVRPGEARWNETLDSIHGNEGHETPVWLFNSDEDCKCDAKEFDSKSEAEEFVARYNLRGKRNIIKIKVVHKNW